MKNTRQLPKGFLVQVTARIHKALGNDLVAIVMFGSQAQGTARQWSDLDLLVIARRLPRGRKRDELFLDAFDDLIMETGIAIMPILMTEKELRFGMEMRSPLLYGVARGYRVVWGNLPILLNWERFIRNHYRFSKRYAVWIIKDPTNPQPKPNLTLRGILNPKSANA